MTGTARLLGAIRSVARVLWHGLRVWCGDAAYETYLSRSRDECPLSADAFYVDRLEHRYRQPNRCC